MLIKYLVLNKEKPEVLNFKNNKIRISGKYDIISIFEKCKNFENLNIENLYVNSIDKIDRFTYRVNCSNGMFYIYLDEKSTIIY